MERLEERLAALPEPGPPSTFAPTVMARIARQPGPSQVGERLHSRARPDRLAPLWAAAGLFIVLAVTAAGLIDGGAGGGSVVAAVGAGTAATGLTGLLLGLGLWLFLLGLFAPLRRKW